MNKPVLCPHPHRYDRGECCGDCPLSDWLLANNVDEGAIYQMLAEELARSLDLLILVGNGAPISKVVAKDWHDRAQKHLDRFNKWSKELAAAQADVVNQRQVDAVAQAIWELGAADDLTRRDAQMYARAAVIALSDPALEKAG